MRFELGISYSPLNKQTCYPVGHTDWLLCFDKFITYESLTSSDLCLKNQTLMLFVNNRGFLKMRCHMAVMAQLYMMLSILPKGIACEC